MRSNDYRFQMAAQDIRQHRVNNHDWPDDWDSVIPLQPLGSSDETFLRRGTGRSVSRRRYIAAIPGLAT